MQRFLLICSIVYLPLISFNFLGCSGGSGGGEGDEGIANNGSPSTNNNPFISIWRTSSDNESITLPLRSSYNYNFTVDWGDGASSEVTSFDDADITHTYVAAGDYTVTISGVVEAWDFHNNAADYRRNIISVVDLGDVNWRNLEGAFFGCENLVEFRGGNVSLVTDMSNMFSYIQVANPDVSQWDTSSVTDMSDMFSYTQVANPDVSQWDTSSVTDMSSMFYSAEVANPDVSQWDTSSVTDMSDMFSYIQVANPDVSQWDTSSVTDMSDMFYSAEVANPDVSQWNTSNVIYMGYLFANASAANPDMSRWDFKNVTWMSSMFEDVTLPTETYSRLLNQIYATSQQDDVHLDGGSSEYNEDARAAREGLVARGWRITDGGLE